MLFSRERHRAGLLFVEIHRFLREEFVDFQSTYHLFHALQEALSIECFIGLQ